MLRTFRPSVAVSTNVVTTKMLLCEQPTVNKYLLFLFFACSRCTRGQVGSWSAFQIWPEIRGPICQPGRCGVCGARFNGKIKNKTRTSWSTPRGSSRDVIRHHPAALPHFSVCSPPALIYSLIVGKTHVAWTGRREDIWAEGRKVLMRNVELDVSVFLGSKDANTDTGTGEKKRPASIRYPRISVVPSHR